MFKTTLCLMAGVAAGLSASAATAETATNSDEVRAIVAEMLSDAETRSSLLQGGGSAGWDDGFFIESGDGSHRLNVHALIQFRYVASFRDDDAVGMEDDFDGDFQTRNTRLRFEGTLYDNWFYRVQGNFSQAGGGNFLEDAYGGYKFEDGSWIGFGQGKVPFTREELVNEGHQLLIETSQVNEYFSAGRTQGLLYGWDGESFRGIVGVTDGARQANTDLGTTVAGSGLPTSDFALTARGEFLLSGSWDQFEDFTSRQGSEDGFMLGVAGHYQTGPGDVTGIDTDIFAYTIDASYESDGWNLFAAVVGRDIDVEGGADGHDYGILLQGGVFVSEDTELYARYGHIFLDDDAVPAGAEDESAEFAFGMNHYFEGHNAKFSADIVYYLDETTSGIGGTIGGNTNIGRLGDNDDGEVSFRAQMQLAF